MTTTGTSGRLATTRSQSARPSMPRMLRSVRTTSTSAVSSAASAASPEVCDSISKPRGPSPAAIASHISRSSSTTRTRPLITPPPTPGGSRRRLRRLRRPRQEDRESAALPQLALDLDPAAVLGDDPVRDREPKARPLPDRLGGEERLEDVRQVVARDAAALVRDRDAEVIRLGGAGSRRTDAAYAGVNAG